MTRRKLRVVYPAYAIDTYNWERITQVLQPISEVCKLTVYHFNTDPSPQADWCNIAPVPKYSNLFNIYQTTRDAMNIAMALPDFDVLYCWSGGAYFQLLSVLTAEIVKKPVVMHINGDAHLSRTHHLNPTEKLLQDAADRLTLNNVNLIVPISSVLREAVLPRVKNKNAVTEPVPFTVDTNDFTMQHYPKEITIGYGGRVSPEKGFPFYINVMEQTKNMRFRVAGPVQMKVQFPDNCHYDGVLSMEWMPRFYALNSAIALPSYGEGIPGMVLEAYACGRPVLVTPESLPSCIPCFGWKIPHDMEKWKAAVEGLTQAEIEEKGAAAREWITHNWLTWEDFAIKMKQYFTQAVNHDNK